jgi:hypothetical protein
LRATCSAAPATSWRIKPAGENHGRSNQHHDRAKNQTLRLQGLHQDERAPATKAWSVLTALDDPDFPDGLYCPQHATLAESRLDGKGA